MNTNEIFKYRSVTACMKASYELITNHLLQFVKKTWWASLAFAVLAAITIYFRMPNKDLHDWGLENPWGAYLIQTMIYLAFFVANIFVGIAIWNWLNGKGTKQNAIRFASIYIPYNIIIFLLLYFAPSFIAEWINGSAATAIQANKSLTSIYCIAGALGIIILILIFVVILPFAYMVPHQMIREKGEAFLLWKSFKCGLCHMGSIFKMGFLCTLILLIITSILSVPCLLLSGAQVVSQLGALNGDPLGVPAYFTILYLVILAITCFLYVYVSAWPCISFVFLYGAIKIQETEKEKKLSYTT